jgi:hypothetical protein
MTIKAAYFALLGHAEARTIDWGSDILPAITRGRSLGILWPTAGQGHNIRAWAELLVVERATLGRPYATPSFGVEVQMMAQRFELLCRETLRYHRNVAYEYEVRQVREAAQWLLTHSLAL